MNRKKHLGVTQDNNGKIKGKSGMVRRKRGQSVLRGGETDGRREEAIVTRQRGTRDVYRRV